MPLPPGTRIGPYEVVSPFGAGGMGEVYRARDSKLHREVAQWEQNAPRTFDVSADGRFLMVEPSPTYSQRFNVVLNWVEELQQLVSSK